MNPAQRSRDLLERIEQRLAALEPESIELSDDSARHAGHAGAGGGGHFELVIVSPRFSGKSRQARHRLIYAALGDMMQREIHAIGIKAYTADEI